MRRLIGPSLMTVAMMVVLLGLGTWQVQRLFWKRALLDRIDQAEAAPPVPLTRDPLPFAKLLAAGTFLTDRTGLYGTEVRDFPTGPILGARLIVPLRLADGEVLLVDRGWVPETRAVPIEQPTGPVTVSGYVRFGDSRHWFSVADDPMERRFFTLDPQAIGRALDQPAVRPFVLVALAPSPDAPPATTWPDPARRLPRPPNSHLSYAATWYGLAIALLAIFVAWARKGKSA